MKLNFLSFIIAIIFNVPNVCLAKKILNEKDEKLIIKYFSSSLLSEQDNKRVRNIIVRVAAKQQKYHLVLSNNSNEKKEKRVNELRLEIFKIKNKASIIASIVDIRELKVIKRVKSRSFPRKDILKNTELALEVLFNISKKPTKTHNRSSLAKRNKFNDKPPENKKIIDFKKRIKNIKTDIAIQLQKEKEDLDSDSANDKKKKKSTLEANSTEDTLKENDNNQPIKKSPRSKKWKFKYSLNLGIQTRFNNIFDAKGEAYEVNISSTYNFLSIGGKVEVANTDYVDAGLDLRFNYLSPIFRHEKVKSNSAIEMGLRPFYRLKRLPISLGFEINKDVIMFANRPVVGQGLKLAVYQLYSYGIGMKYFITETNNLDFSFDLPFMVQYGNIEELNSGSLTSNKLSIKYTHDLSWLWKGSKAILSYSRRHMVISDFYTTELTENRLYLSGIYEF